MLLTLAEANAAIARGNPLIIAGSRPALAGLQPGNWIAGTIPYFMADTGACCDRSKVFVQQINLPTVRSKIQAYKAADLARIPQDAFEHGFSYVIIPANSQAHLAYATHAPQYPDIFMKPVIGWISGVHLDDLATDQPVVIDGRTTTALSNEAIVLHVEVKPEHQPIVQTVNLFRPGTGVALEFERAGFEAVEASVEGHRVNLARYMTDFSWDPSLPLVADYAGTSVNVSSKAIDPQNGRVSFYAPVFPGVKYFKAQSVGDYVETFGRNVPRGVTPVLSCNCILNYLYGQLEGRKTGPFTGPITFGEIAHQLLNQTLVYLVSGDGTGE